MKYLGLIILGMQDSVSIIREIDLEMFQLL